MASEGQIDAPIRATGAIPVPLAELFITAVEHERRGRLIAAQRVLGHILEAAPEQADSLHLAGIVAYRQGRRSEALTLMRRSIEYGVNTPLYWRNICEVLRVLGHLDEALAAGRTAVRLNPDDPITLSNLAVILAERLEHDEAIACTKQALALDPSHVAAHFGLAEILLMRGEMARGWEEYEWRFAMPKAAINLPPAQQRPPKWDGLPICDLMVIADQGFGDGIQFCRYLPWVLERCPDPVLVCSAEMQSILGRFGVGRMTSRWQDAAGCLAYVPLSGLPRLARTRIDTIPYHCPYLTADSLCVTAWSEFFNKRVAPTHKRVGIVWAGRASHANDHRRSMGFDMLSPIAACDDITLISLQKGDHQMDVGWYSGRAPLVNLGPALTDWHQTMAILANLDLVITIDSAVAHLAGAMGRPVWIMLSHAGEWRWLMNRADTPWYPTARLFRQDTPGVWETVVGEVTTELNRLTNRRQVDS